MKDVFVSPWFDRAALFGFHCHRFRLVIEDTNRDITRILLTPFRVNKHSISNGTEIVLNQL